MDSVLPAPDSPETTMDWDCFKTFMSRKALSTVVHQGKISNLKFVKDEMKFLTDSKHVRRHGSKRLSLIPLNGISTVEVLDLKVRIDGDQDIGYISVDLISAVAQSHIVQ